MKQTEVRFVGPHAYVDPWVRAAGQDLTAYSHEDDGAADVRLQAAYFVMDRACLSLMYPATLPDDAQLTSSFGPRSQYQNEFFADKIASPLSENHLGWDIAWGNPRNHFRANVPISSPVGGEVTETYDRKPSNSGLYLKVSSSDHIAGSVLNFHHMDPLIRTPVGRTTPAAPGVLVGTVQPHGNDPHLHLALKVPHSTKSAYINYPVGELADSPHYGLAVSPYYIWGWDHLPILPRRLLLNFLYIAEGPLSPLGVLHTCALAMVFRDDRVYPDNHIRSRIKKACAFWYGVWTWGRFDLNPIVTRHLSTIPVDDPSAVRLWNPVVGSSVFDSSRLSDVTSNPGSAYSTLEAALSLIDTLSIAFSLVCPSLGRKDVRVAGYTPLYPEIDPDFTYRGPQVPAYELSSDYDPDGYPLTEIGRAHV